MEPTLERVRVGDATGDWAGAMACLGSVYQAAVDGGWQSVLEAVVRSFAADRAALLEVTGADAIVLAAVEVAPAEARRLAEWAQSTTPTDRERAGAEVPVLHDEGCTHCVHASAPADLGSGSAVLCCLGWTIISPPDGATERLGRLAPHLARAFAIAQRLRRAAGHAEVAAAVLDRVTLGAVLVDRRARPLLANRAAQRMAQELDGFHLEPRGLRAASAADSKNLRQLIAAVSRRRGGGLGERGSALRLERPSGRSAYEVLVLPLPRTEAGDLLSDAAAVVFVTDPERVVQTPEQFVRDLYDLTPAEARLAMLLARGYGLTAAADLLGVSRNTAHTHLSRIFLKTGTTRQSDLVRRLLTAPARLAAEESSGHLPVVE